MTRRTLVLAVAGVLLLAVACTTQESAVDRSLGSWSVAIANGKASFAGASMRVTGQRVSPDDLVTPAPTDDGYRCASSLTENNCFDLGPGAAVAIDDLCPSVDAPIGVWNFSYELYDSAQCTGTQLNAAASAYACFDADELFDADHPNASVGVFLDAGVPTEGSLVCVNEANSLGFVQQPTPASTGVAIAPPVVVQLLDPFGDPLPTAGTLVGIAVASGPAPLAATSTTTVATDSQGRATFANLVPSVAGTYTLRASAIGAAVSTSAPFLVTVPLSPTLEYAGMGPVASGKNNGSLVVAYPAGVAANDLLVLVRVNAVDTAAATPAGWTLRSDQFATTPAKFRMTTWSRLASGETSVTLGLNSDSNGVHAAVLRYTRPSGYPPTPAVATEQIRQGLGGAAATLTPSPALTTSADKTTVLTIVAIRAGNTLSLGAGQGFALRAGVVGNQQKQAVAFGLADLVVPASGATPTSPTWAQSGTAAQWAWATLAFH